MLFYKSFAISLSWLFPYRNISLQILRSILHVILQVMNLISDVKGKVAVMVDDMIDTAGGFLRPQLFFFFFFLMDEKMAAAVS